MRFIASLIVGMMVVAALAGVVSGAENEDTCAVLFDFGNGRVMWADVPVTEGMNALNATLTAAEEMDLEISAAGGYVSSIGGYDDDWPMETWNLWVWNHTINGWEGANVGAAGILIENGDTVLWSYAAYRDTTLFIPPHAPLATPEHRYPWTSFRYDSMNSGMQEFGTIEHPALNWSKDLGNGAIDTSVIGANGLLYVSTGGKWGATNSALICLDRSGNEVWRADTGGSFQVATPLLYGNMVIAPSNDGKLYAFYAANGTAKWTFDTGSGEVLGISSSPIEYLGRVIVAASDGNLYSISAEEGTLHKSVEVASKIYYASPAVMDGVIYIGDDDGYVSAYDSESLAEIWSTKVGGIVSASPLIDATKGQVVITSSGANGNITALNMTDGEIAWNTAIGGSSKSVAMTSIGYVAATTTDLIMVDFNGEKLWNCSLGVTIGGAAPTVVGDLIFAVTNEAASRLVAVNLTGDMVSEIVLEPVNYALCSPTFIDGFLYVASDNGWIYAFTTGTADEGNPTDPGSEETPDGIPWPLIGGIAAIVIVVAIGLLYWKGKKGSA